MTQLTGAEIVAVVCHERYTLGGADPTSEEFENEYEAWCSPESPIFEGLESGDFDLTDRGDARGARRRRRADRHRRRRPGAGARRLNDGSGPLTGRLTRDRLVTTLDTDVLVVGSGPSGSAIALRLAPLGHRVTLVEKRAVPRHKACGDVLTPRAVAELARLDVDPLDAGGRPHRRAPTRRGHRSKASG